MYLERDVTRSEWRHHEAAATTAAAAAASAISKQTSTVITCVPSRGLALLQAAITVWQHLVNCPPDCYPATGHQVPGRTLMAVKRTSASDENWNTQQSRLSRILSRIDSCWLGQQIECKMMFRISPHLRQASRCVYRSSGRPLLTMNDGANVARRLVT